MAALSRTSPQTDFGACPEHLDDFYNPQRHIKVLPAYKEAAVGLA
jgi:hypothetical protein